jgi:hypothetical protein
MQGCYYIDEERPTLAGADSAYRRSLYRGFFALLVSLSSEAVLPTRRCGSAFPLGGDTMNKANYLDFVQINGNVQSRQQGW